METYKHVSNYDCGRLFAKMAIIPPNSCCVPLFNVTLPVLPSEVEER